MISNATKIPEGNAAGIFAYTFSAHVIGVVAVVLMIFLPVEIRPLAHDHAWRLLLLPLILLVASPLERIFTSLAGRKELRPFFFALLLGLLMSGTLLWRVVSAEWSPVDDHEIVRFLGPDWYLNSSELLSAASESEITKWGTYKRYRPIYYALRILECWAWGPRLELWYIARIMLLGISLGGSLFIMRRHLGWLPALTLTSFLMTEPFWADVWSRLGPSEIYCTPGTVFFLVGFQILWNARSSPSPTIKPAILAPGLAALCSGFIMAIGSKENFLVLCLPVFALLVHSLTPRPFSRAIAIACGTLLTLAALLAIGVAKGVSTLGHVYGESTSVSALHLLRSIFAPKLFPFWGSIALALVTTYAMWMRSSKTACRTPLSMIPPWMLWMGAGLMAYASQAAFYGESWPTIKSRYDFPGVIIALTLPALLFGMMRGVAERAGFPPKPFTILRTWLAAGLIVLISLKGFTPLTDATKRQVSNTKRYTSALQSLVRLAEKDENVPIVLYSYGHWDAEPLFATSCYLKNFGLQNPLYTEIHHNPADSHGNPRAQRKTEKMRRESAKGSADRFRPLSELGNTPHIGAIFSGDHGGGNCVKTVRVY